MSQPRTSVITGLISVCGSALRTCEAAIDGCGQTIIQCGQLFATAHAERREYLTAMTAELHARQRAVCEELGPCLVRAEHRQQLRVQAAALVAATTIERVNRARTALLKSVQHEQVAVAQFLAPTIAKAAAASGFSTVKHFAKPGKPLVILGEDANGRALQVQLRCIPGRPLTLTTETIGFPQGACARPLALFDDELRRRGISIERNEPEAKLRRFARRVRVRR